ncbi:Glycoside hydrolase [Mycena indigotica]|uniref:alpha-L-fucosidase n=1 Tax=Mycena indigotica TaxID=2126181 RepID=A0A8H6VQ49_9AGAR|nr:Glycoside hydrolase [Mycena indigotica]KAF7289967.1 Glycoside hydrolase [Mycena indigotica]
MIFLPFLLDILCSLSFSNTAVTAALAIYPSQPIGLETLLNNNAVVDFSGNGGAFNGSLLPTGSFSYDGLTFSLPSSWDDAADNNVLANGQVLKLDKPTFAHELHFLYAGDGDNASPTLSVFTLQFSDGSSYTINGKFVEAKSWWVWANVNRAAIITPYHFQGGTKNFNATNIYEYSTAVPSESPLTAIVFPSQTTGSRMHVFALSITPSSTDVNSAALALSIRRAHFSQRWQLVNGDRVQAVQVTIANLLPGYTLAQSPSRAINSPHSIEIVGDGLKTLNTGNFSRLVPGDQARVDVFVTGARAGGSAMVNIRDSTGKIIATSTALPTALLIEEYTPDTTSLSLHETPSWWNSAKYGIFIHWGVYSKPAFVNRAIFSWMSTEFLQAPPNQYAEWYDWDIRQPPDASNPTWVHHLDTYGKDVAYDDFIPQFTASKFNASAWVDIIDRAGAKYFVLVSKHHDGFALFDTGNTTNRNSVQLGPKRDLVAELFQTAKDEKPDLHRGTYYSLPEWFSPDFAKYGFGSWPGGLAHNAFNTTPALEPYTGRLDIDDYLTDLQLPQMVDLATKYDTEIMWCDIGGPNRNLEFAATFYNHAMSQGRQVTLNDRCGILPDFDTPEYATFGSIQPTKWESSEGMDPFSYGLNLATNASQYKNGTTIVQSLVDITAKNGNFLLDIGPTADGEIIQPMVDNLLDAGSWLEFAGDCVYDTDYWFPASEDPKPVNGTPAARFTTTPNTFCIIAFAPPSDGSLVVGKRLPLMLGDEIVALRPSGPSSPLAWNISASGDLTIQVSSADVEGVRFAWPFRVS